MQLKELVTTFPSNFKGQVRHIAESIPPQFCNGKLHKLQVLVAYANYFVELVEIYPHIAYIEENHFGRFCTDFLSLFGG